MQLLRKRTLFIRNVSFMLFAILLLSLAGLQLFKGSEYTALAEQTRIRHITEKGVRGKILDRHGEVIATSVPSYSINLDSQNIKTDALNDTVYKALSLLKTYQTPLTLSLPLTMQDGAVVFSGREIDTYLAEINGGAADAASALLTLYQQLGISESYSITDGLLLTHFAMGSQNDANAYTGLASTQAHQLLALAKDMGIPTTMPTGTTIRFDAKEQSIDTLFTFIARCKNVVGTYPYQGYVPLATDGDQVVWNTPTIVKLKRFLSLSDSATAEEVLSALITKYKAEGYVDDPLLLDLLAVRYGVSGRTYRRYDPLQIATTQDFSLCAILAENSISLPGITLSEGYVRQYPDGSLLSPLLGYTGRITAEQKEEMESKGYDIHADVVGRDGLERMLEEFLRPQDGRKSLVVDSLGRAVQSLSQEAAQKGSDITLTIDSALQKAANESLNTTMADIRAGKMGQAYPNAKVGAAVVVDVHNGEILAMASSPNYDANVFSETMDTDTWNALNPTYTTGKDNHVDTDPTLPRPMFNAPVTGVYPPGSTYKPFVAAAALEEGVVSARETITDLGRYTHYSTTLAPACWLYRTNGATHGAENVVSAIAHSCNYYFYEVGYRLGSETLEAYAKKFGFGTDSDSGLLGEATGIIGGRNYTTRALKQKIANRLIRKSIEESTAQNLADALLDTPTMENATALLTPHRISTEDAAGLLRTIWDEQYQPSQILSLAVGQGENSFTVLQMANATAALTQGGKRYVPSIVKAIDGQEAGEAQVAQEAFLSPNTQRTIHQGMLAAVAPGGTAANVFRNCPVTVAGKTGSAQANGKDAYGWFIAYAPAEDPQIAIAVMIAQAGSGNNVAPVVRDIVNAHFGVPKEE
ncbi:hypothetical protein LJC20_04590 [Eubacteriales bacterium OttesenSCG-928-M02]|nr:hypothetical protein [Eubacteriales bacterium OttesenSCG-928-M02]